MSPDFLIHSEYSPAAGVLYIVTPQNTRALCWMIVHTTPTQRPQQTLAYLDFEALPTFSQDAALDGLSFEEQTALQNNRITLIPGQPVLARFTGPHADEVKATFESDTIPTPYDSRQPRCDILRVIQRQNPTATVEWESAPTQHNPDRADQFKRLLYER